MLKYNEIDLEDMNSEDILDEIIYILREQVKWWREENGMLESEISELMQDMYERITNNLDFS